MLMWQGVEYNERLAQEQESHRWGQPAQDNSGSSLGTLSRLGISSTNQMLLVVLTSIIDTS